MVFSGQEDVPGVMVVIVPLRAIPALRRIFVRIEHGRAVVVVFQHQMDVPAGFGREIADGAAEIVQHRDLALFGNGMHRIQPQPVKTVLAQPVQRVFDREGAHLRHAVIDRAAPRRLRLGKERWRIAAEVIPLGTEVIVDHVEEHHHSAQMRRVDQGFQIVGAAIGAVGRVPQHAVIAPVARSRKIRQRHQFQSGDSGGGEMIESFDHGAVAAVRHEGADMGFDQYGFMPRPTAPVRRPPSVVGMIDHLARPRDVVRLKGGGWIRHIDLVVDPESVARAGFHAGDIGGKPAIIAASHGVTLFQQDLDSLGRRRP